MDARCVRVSQIIQNLSVGLRLWPIMISSIYNRNTFPEFFGIIGLPGDVAIIKLDITSLLP